MITKRIIPCLDVKNGRVVKGVNFEGLQDMADPVEMARYYNASGADELVFTILRPVLRGADSSPIFCARSQARFLSR